MDVEMARADRRRWRLERHAERDEQRRTRRGIRIEPHAITQPSIEETPTMTTTTADIARAVRALQRTLDAAPLSLAIAAIRWQDQQISRTMQAVCAEIKRRAAAKESAR
jgi:hypothetical protein